MRPLVAVLSTGTELMRGRSVDTHLGHFARAIERIGLEVDFHATCGDDFARIVDELKLAAARADVILFSGGLGPTEDDLTRAAVSEAFHRELKFRPVLWKTIRARFRIPMAAINRRQAFLPDGAEALPNPNGSAPGFALEAGGVKFFALPGPPREMIPMFEAHVMPRLPRAARFALWEGASVGLPEGDVDTIAHRIVKGASYGLTVKSGVVNIAVRGGRIRPIVDRLRRALGSNLLEAPTLAASVAKLLGRRTIAVAESCTGGLIASKLTDVPGISANLIEACVTYSNGSKVARLGVPPGLIQRHGAVSAQVVLEMADGIRRTSGADIGVAVTGIAGPDGGSKEKPVGLVYHAVSAGGRTRVERRVWPGGRSDVKERAANFALDLLRRRLQA